MLHGPAGGGGITDGLGGTAWWQHWVTGAMVYRPNTGSRMDSHESRHLAIFISSLRGGGAERVGVLLANRFADMGHRVDLVLLQREGPYLEELSPSVNIVDLDCYSARAGLLPLMRYLRHERPDAMLSALTTVNIMAALARKLSGCSTRLILSEHSLPSRNLAGGGRNRVRRLFIRKFYPLADAVICVSHGVQADLAEKFRLPPAMLHVIHNPVDLDRVQQMMREPVPHEWFSPDNAPVILGAGRLVASKDYPTLLAAFARLCRIRPARLVILGKGPLEAELKQYAKTLGIAGEVDFPGFQQNPWAWMRAADLFVLSSKWEGLGNVVIEALACGVPVVSTDCSTGPAEILDDGRLGYLAPVGDPEMLARLMERVLSNPDAARQADPELTRFAVEKISQRYLSVLLETGRDRGARSSAAHVPHISA